MKQINRLLSDHLFNVSFERYFIKRINHNTYSLLHEKFQFIQNATLTTELMIILLLYFRNFNNFSFNLNLIYFTLFLLNKQNISLFCKALHKSLKHNKLPRSFSTNHSCKRFQESSVLPREIFFRTFFPLRICNNVTATMSFNYFVTGWGNKRYKKTTEGF